MGRITHSLEPRYAWYHCKGIDIGLRHQQYWLEIRGESAYGSCLLPVTKPTTGMFACESRSVQDVMLSSAVLSNILVKVVADTICEYKKSVTVVAIPASTHETLSASIHVIVSNGLG